MITTKTERAIIHRAIADQGLGMNTAGVFEESNKRLDCLVSFAKKFHNEIFSEEPEKMLHKIVAYKRMARMALRGEK